MMAVYELIVLDLDTGHAGAVVSLVGAVTKKGFREPAPFRATSSESLDFKPFPAPLCVFP